MTESVLRVLLVDDDEDENILTQALLADIPGFNFQLDWEPLYNPALEKMAANQHDAYLVDYRLNGEKDGLDLLREAIAKGCQCPIIILTGQGDHNIDLAAMESGAADYLAKAHLTAQLLEHSLRYAIQRKRSQNLQSAIYRISEAAHAAQDLPELFKLVHVIVANLIPAKNFYIALFDETARTISFAYYVDEKDPPPPIEKIKLKETRGGMTDYLLRTGKPLLLTQQKYTNLVTEGKIEVIGTPPLAWLGIPLKAGKKKIGALAVQSYTQGVTYTQADQDVLSFVSTQIAMAIERKQVEAALRESETRYRAIINDQTDLICRFLPDGKATFANQAFCRYFDRSLEELIGNRFLLDLAIDNWDQMLAMLSNLTPSNPVMAVEHRLILSEGRICWQQWTNRALFNEQGCLLGFQAVGQDITERKRIEALEQDRRNILELIAHDQPLEHILEMVIQMIEHNQPGLGVSVFLLRDGCLYHKVALNLPEDCIEAMDNLDVKQGGQGEYQPTIWSQTIYGSPELPDDEGFISKDIAKDPRWEGDRDVLLSHQFTASVVMPIKSGSNEIFGILAGFSTHAWQSEEQIINLFDATASIAGLAIERQRLNERLIFQAMYDELTGLPNRHLMGDRLRQDIAEARRKNSLVGLLFFDLNRFRNINETLGHAVGDELLKQIAGRFALNIRLSDTLARIGNDNFVVILTDIKTITDVIQIAYKLLDVLKSPYQIEDHDLYLDASVGVSIYPRDGQDVESLVKNADIAQAFAKTSGRSQVECYEPAMSALAMERLQIANRLRRGIERGELCLYYQPQINIKSGEVVGLEALLRWQHPDLGIILPGEFISLAEESGLIFTIGEWVLQEVCNQISAWRQAGITPVRVAVNVSPTQFSQSDLIDGILNTLKEKQLSAEYLAIEITENIFMNDVEAVAKRLLRLREQGVKIFLDDFGTAYSSLAYLRGLPLDYIKIDKTFVDDLVQIADLQQKEKLARHFDPSALVKAMITLAHGLNMEVVAEGVEKGEQLKVLNDLGCDRAQGYLIARPMPADQILKQCFVRY